MLKSRSARGSENCTLASYLMPPTHDTDEGAAPLACPLLRLGEGAAPRAVLTAEVVAMRAIS